MTLFPFSRPTRPNSNASGWTSDINNTKNKLSLRRKRLLYSDWKASLSQLKPNSRSSLNAGSSLTQLKTVIICLTLLVVISFNRNVEGVCVWQGGGGFRLACGFRQSGLFRIRSLGGLKGWAGAGFTIGDEDGFKDSLTNDETKKQQQQKLLQQQQHQRQLQQQQQQQRQRGLFSFGNSHQQQQQSFQQRQQQQFQHHQPQNHQLFGQYSNVNVQKAPETGKPSGNSIDALTTAQQHQLLEQLQQYAQHQSASAPGAGSASSSATALQNQHVLSRTGLQKRSSLWRWPLSLFPQRKGAPAASGQGQIHAHQQGSAPAPMPTPNQKNRGVLKRGPFASPQGRGPPPHMRGPYKNNLPPPGYMNTVPQNPANAINPHQFNGPHLAHLNPQLESQRQGVPYTAFNPMPLTAKDVDMEVDPMTAAEATLNDGRPYGLKLLEGSLNYGKKFVVEQLPKQYGVSPGEEVAATGQVGYDTNIFPDIYFTTTTSKGLVNPALNQLNLVDLNKKMLGETLDKETSTVKSRKSKQKTKLKKVRVIKHRGNKESPEQGQGTRQRKKPPRPSTEQSEEVTESDELPTTEPSSTTLKSTTSSTQKTTTTTQTSSTSTFPSTTTNREHPSVYQNINVPFNFPAPEQLDLPTLYKFLSEKDRDRNLKILESLGITTTSTTTPAPPPPPPPTLPPLAPPLPPKLTQLYSHIQSIYHPTEKTVIEKPTEITKYIAPLITKGNYDPRYPPDHPINREKLRAITSTTTTTTTTTPSPFFTSNTFYNPTNHFSKHNKQDKPVTHFNNPKFGRDHQSFIHLDSTEAAVQLNKTKSYNERFYSHFSKNSQHSLGEGEDDDAKSRDIYLYHAETTELYPQKVKAPSYIDNGRNTGSYYNWNTLSDYPGSFTTTVSSSLNFNGETSSPSPSPHGGFGSGYEAGQPAGSFSGPNSGSGFSHVSSVTKTKAISPQGFVGIYTNLDPEMNIPQQSQTQVQAIKPPSNRHYSPPEIKTFVASTPSSSNNEWNAPNTWKGQDQKQDRFGSDLHTGSDFTTKNYYSPNYPNGVSVNQPGSQDSQYPKIYSSPSYSNVVATTSKSVGKTTMKIVTPRHGPSTTAETTTSTTTTTTATPATTTTTTTTSTTTTPRPFMRTSYKPKPEPELETEPPVLTEAKAEIKQRERTKTPLRKHHKKRYRLRPINSTSTTTTTKAPFRVVTSVSHSVSYKEDPTETDKNGRIRTKIKGPGPTAPYRNKFIHSDHDDDSVSSSSNARNKFGTQSELEEHDEEPESPQKFGNHFTDEKFGFPSDDEIRKIVSSEAPIDEVTTVYPHSRRTRPRPHHTYHKGVYSQSNTQKDDDNDGEDDNSNAHRNVAFEREKETKNNFRQHPSQVDEAEENERPGVPTMFLKPFEVEETPDSDGFMAPPAAGMNKLLSQVNLLAGQAKKSVLEDFPRNENRNTDNGGNDHETEPDDEAVEKLVFLPKEESTDFQHQLHGGQNEEDPATSREEHEETTSRRPSNFHPSDNIIPSTYRPHTHRYNMYRKPDRNVESDNDGDQKNPGYYIIPPILPENRDRQNEASGFFDQPFKIPEQMMMAPPPQTSGDSPPSNYDNEGSPDEGQNPISDVMMPPAQSSFSYYESHGQGSGQAIAPSASDSYSEDPNMEEMESTTLKMMGLPQQMMGPPPLPDDNQILMNPVYDESTDPPLPNQNFVPPPPSQYQLYGPFQANNQKNDQIKQANGPFPPQQFTTTGHFHSNPPPSQGQQFNQQNPFSNLNPFNQNTNQNQRSPGLLPPAPSAVSAILNPLRQMIPTFNRRPAPLPYPASHHRPSFPAHVPGQGQGQGMPPAPPSYNRNDVVNTPPPPPNPIFQNNPRPLPPRPPPVGNSQNQNQYPHPLPNQAFAPHPLPGFPPPSPHQPSHQPLPMGIQMGPPMGPPNNVIRQHPLPPPPPSITSSTTPIPTTTTTTATTTTTTTTTPKPLTEKESVLKALETLSKVKSDVIKSIVQEKLGSRKPPPPIMTPPPPPPSTTTAIPQYLQKFAAKLTPQVFSTGPSAGKDKGSAESLSDTVGGGSGIASISTDALSNLFSSKGSKAKKQESVKPPEAIQSNHNPNFLHVNTGPSFESQINQVLKKKHDEILAKQLLKQQQQQIQQQQQEQSHSAPPLTLNANQNEQLLKTLSQIASRLKSPEALAANRTYSAVQVDTMRKLLALNKIEETLKLNNLPNQNQLPQTLNLNSLALNLNSNSWKPQLSSLLNSPASNQFQHKIDNIQEPASSTIISSPNTSHNSNGNVVLNGLQNALAGASVPTILALKKMALEKAQGIQPSPELGLPQQIKPSEPSSGEQSGNKGGFQAIDLSAILASPSPIQLNFPQESQSRWIPGTNSRALEIRDAPKSFYPGDAILKFDSNENLMTDFQCEKQEFFPGLYADPALSCKIFHLCAKSDSGGYVRKTFRCPQETVFDQEVLRCNWNLYVDCNGAEKKYNFNKYLSQSFQFLRILGEFSASYKGPNSTAVVTAN